MGQYTMPFAILVFVRQLVLALHTTLVATPHCSLLVGRELGNR